MGTPATTMQCSATVALALAVCLVGLAAAAPETPSMRYSSAGASGTASGAASGAASGTTTTGAVSVTQVVTLSISASQYTGNMKTLMETAYGMALGIYDTANSGYFTGCSVTSSATRRSASVTFVAQVSSTKPAAMPSLPQASTLLCSLPRLLWAAHTAALLCLSPGWLLLRSHPLRRQVLVT